MNAFLLMKIMKAYTASAVARAAFGMSNCWRRIICPDHVTCFYPISMATASLVGRTDVFLNRVGPFSRAGPGRRHPKTTAPSRSPK